MLRSPNTCIGRRLLIPSTGALVTDGYGKYTAETISRVTAKRDPNFQAKRSTSSLKQSVTFHHYVLPGNQWYIWGLVPALVKNRHSIHGDRFAPSQTSWPKPTTYIALAYGR